MIKIILAFYGSMALVGLALVRWRMDEDFLFDPLTIPDYGNSLLYVSVTLLCLAAFHLFGRVSLKHWSLMKECATDVRHMMGSMNRRQIALTAVFSGIGEELLFRGWLLNEMGLVLSSLIFALIHFPPNRRWIFWPFFAFIAGLVLGGLCLWTQTIFFAVLLHAGINFFNLELMIGRKKQRIELD